MLISAALFALGALYTWWRGPSANVVAPAEIDSLDDELDVALVPAATGGR